MKLSTKDGRKYTFVIAVFIAAIVLLACGTLTGDQWVTTIIFLGGFFTLGNTAEKIMERRNGHE